MTNPNPGTLYVFLEGLFVVEERASHMEVVLPDVPGHRRKAGSWIAETPIAAEKELRLHGVDAGAAAFSQTDFTVRLPGTALTSKKRGATLWLPRPKQILGFLLARPTLPPHPPRTAASPALDFVARSKDGKHTFKKLAAVQVLVYHYADENEVFLEGHYWEPRPTDGAVSVHFISTSEERESQEHEEETEDVLHEVLRYYPGLEYRFPRPVAAPWMDPVDPYSFGDLGGLKVQGEYIVEANTNKFAFALAELEHPASRVQRLALLGHLKQGKGPVGGLWRAPQFLSDRTSNCMTIGT